MSKINVKKITLFIVVLIIAMVILPKLKELYYIEWDDFYVPQSPQDEILQSVTDYIIDPDTILKSLKDGQSDVFTAATPDTETPVSSAFPSNSFLWKAEDYLYIANALHEHEWKESLAKWQLYSMKFSINRCHSVDEGIDFADLTYYQRQGDLYVVHGMWIAPLLGEVTIGSSEYPYRKEWTPIDLNKLAVKIPDKLLELAEASGGREARKKLNENGCHINIHLDPDASVFSSFSNPFKHYGLGWEILYWDNDNHLIFSDTIDPYSGK